MWQWLLAGCRGRRRCRSHTQYHQTERLGLWYGHPRTFCVCALTVHTEPQRAVFSAHSNAIFDLKWHPNDEYIATASGDQTIVISSVRNENRVTTLVGHTQSVKCLAWDPENGDVLCSGGRDGTINIWDLRVGERWRTVIGRGELRPVLTMPHAHKDMGSRSTPNGRKVARSITSLVYAVGNPYSVISSGAFDGCVGFVWSAHDLSPCSIAFYGNGTSGFPVLNRSFQGGRHDR